MKMLLAIIGGILAGTTVAQEAQAGGQLQAEVNRQPQEHLEIEKPENYNEIKGDDVTLSGISVTAMKAENKLQLLNPVTPEEYGSPEDSVVRDPVTREVSGLKLFSIEF